MGSPTNEAGLVRAITREIARTYPDAWVFKTVGSPLQVSGIPDLLLSVQGRFIGMEAKFQRPGESRNHALGRVTMQQRGQIKKINDSGGTAGAVLSVEDALDLIEKALSQS